MRLAFEYFINTISIIELIGAIVMITVFVGVLLHIFIEYVKSFFKNS